MTTNEQLYSQSHVGFRYIIEIDNDRLAAFTECTLPTIEWELEEIKEGGLNTYVHQLPGRRKSSRLTLKHGIGKSALFTWYMETVSEQFTPKNISITLLDVTGTGVAAWNIEQALPVKWSGPQLKSDSNSVAIQSLEFVCANVTVDDSPSISRAQQPEN